MAAMAHIGLARQNGLAALALDVLVLYLTLGFRQFSHYFTDIRAALDHGDIRHASLLFQAMHKFAAEYPPH